MEQEPIWEIFILRTVLSTGLFILSLFLAMVSLYDLRGYRHLQALVLSDALSTQSLPRDEGLLDPAQGISRLELGKDIELRRDTPGGLLAGANTDLRSARFFYRSGLLESEMDVKIERTCEALSRLGQALTKQPLHSRALMNWANLRQVLGPISCASPYTEGDFEAVARFALAHDPFNTEVMYAAAQILDWGGKEFESRKLLNRFLSLATSLRPAQEEFVLQRLRSPEQIAEILPQRFPQIIEWSARLRERSPGVFESAAPVIAQMQLAGIDQNDRAFEAGTIPAELFYRRLVQLLDAAALSSVRQRLDSELMKYYTLVGKRDVVDYLEQRKRYVNLEIIPAGLVSDTRPLKSSLFQWGLEGRVAFNTYFNSIGFFLADRQSPRLIQLAADGRTGGIVESDIRVFASDDNRRWAELPAAQMNVKTMEIGERSIVVIRLPEQAHRYWKIHYANSARRGTFINELAGMISVYGFSNRVEAVGGTES